MQQHDQNKEQTPNSNFERKAAGPDIKKEKPDLGKKKDYVEKDFDEDIETERDEEIEEGGESKFREGWK